MMWKQFEHFGIADRSLFMCTDLLRWVGLFWKVLLKLIIERPEAANSLFESLSLEMRKQPPPLEAVAPEPVVEPEPEPEAESEALPAETPAEGDASSPDGEEVAPPAPKKKPKVPALPLTPAQARAAQVHKLMVVHTNQTWTTITHGHVCTPSLPKQL
jgi:hypothetical protein